MGGWRDKKSYEILKKLFVNVYMEFDNQELHRVQEHDVDTSTRRASSHLFGWKTNQFDTLVGRVGLEQSSPTPFS